MITLPILKFPGFTPSSCLTVAAIGSVALMPLASKAKECTKGVDTPCEVVGEDSEGGELRIIEVAGDVLVTEHVINEADLEQVIELVDPVVEGPDTEGPVIKGPKHFDGVPAEVEVRVEPLDIRKDKAAKEMICKRLPALVPINQGFNTDLYAQLRGTEDNVFYSPHSITQAMSMVYLGAKGDTAKEFAAAMSFKLDPQAHADALHKLRHQVLLLGNRGDDRLKIANALCVTGKKPKQTYLEAVRTHFGAEVFDGGTEQINSWVKKQTEGNIEKILDQLDPNSACVLLNAVYFKGTWRHPFSPSNTRERDFHVTADKSVKVPMMSREGHYALARNDQYLAVELPYKTSCSMVLIMPAKADGMEQLETGLSKDFIQQVCNQLKGAGQQIELALPKFKIKTEYDLVDSIKQLGLVKAFDGGQADFSAMYDRDDVSIARIKHKATLEVDEQGAVASAVTGIEMKLESASLPPTRIYFDRPFLVLIRENVTNTTLFMGRISDPTM